MSINRNIYSAEPSNTYLPPPTPSTEIPIVIHPPDDLEYLPPFHEEIPPPQTEPPQIYLPHENVSEFSFKIFKFLRKIIVFVHVPGA